MIAVEVSLSKWLFNAVQAHEVLTINPDYFRLRKPIERRLYELARKHCGSQAQFFIGLSSRLAGRTPKPWLGIMSPPVAVKRPVGTRSEQVRSLLKTSMLSPDHKAALLHRAGFPVPAAPMNCTACSSAARNENGSRGPASADDACVRWCQAIDALFVAHSIARAMCSLQQKELRLRDVVAHYLPPQSRSAAPEDH